MTKLYSIGEYRDTPILSDTNHIDIHPLIEGYVSGTRSTSQFLGYLYTNKIVSTLGVNDDVNVILEALNNIDNSISRLRVYLTIMKKLHILKKSYYDEKLLENLAKSITLGLVLRVSSFEEFFQTINLGLPNIKLSRDTFKFYFPEDEVDTIIREFIEANKSSEIYIPTMPLYIDKMKSSERYLLVNNLKFVCDKII